MAGVHDGLNTIGWVHTTINPSTKLSYNVMYSDKPGLKLTNTLNLRSLSLEHDLYLASLAASTSPPWPDVKRLSDHIKHFHDGHSLTSTKRTRLSRLPSDISATSREWSLFPFSNDRRLGTSYPFLLSLHLTASQMSMLGRRYKHALQSYNRKLRLGRTNTSKPMPQEIIDYILDFYHDDFATLKTASLVCHSWLSPCLTHLFRSVSFNFTARWTRPLPSTIYSRLQASPFKLNHYVKEVCVQLTDKEGQILIHQFPKAFINLQKLSMRIRTGEFSTVDWVVSTTRRLTYIFQLQLSKYAPLRNVDIWIGSVFWPPSVRLSVSRCIFEQGSSCDSQAGGPFYQLEEVKLIGGLERCIVTSLVALQVPQIRVNQVRSLGVHRCTAKDIPNVNSTIRALNESVEILNISLAYWFGGPSSVQTLDLHLLVRLQRLVMTDITGAFKPDTLMSWFAQFSIKPSSLTSITLSFMYHTRSEIPYKFFDWKGGRNWTVSL